MSFEYGKWDSPEEAEVVYKKIKSGEWSLERFESWKSQVEVEEYRSATADESF